MNKTVNINLGGLFFHIDEDAYQKLTRYFDAIKRSLSNSTGQDEIIKDIEMRIAELVSEKHTSDKQVLNIAELDEIIAIMGQPEDYRLEDEDAPTARTYDYAGLKRHKKLYRDTEKGMLGGVCTGLGHYFAIDAVWLKILMVIFVVAGFGSGIVAYLILWIVTPAAVTTTEKLEMTGEPVTISNIERKVREEFENVSDRFKNANYDKMGHQVKTGAERFASNVGEVFSAIFKGFAKVLGALITVMAAVFLVMSLVGLFTLGSTSAVDMPWQNYANALNFTDYPLWIIGLLGFLAVGIPLFFLLILGLKLLVNNLKSIGNIVKYTLLALWLIAVAALVTLGIKQATEVAFEGNSLEKRTIEIAKTDTIYVKFRFNDFYSKTIENRHDFIFTQDEAGVEQIYSNHVGLHILRTDELRPYLQIERKSQGKSLSEAKARAEEIKYGFRVEGNQIILDNYLLTETKNKYRDQQVEIFLYLPKGTLLKPDNSVQDYDWSDDEEFNLHYSGNYLYRSGDKKIMCVDCPPQENEYEDLENAPDSLHTTTVTVDGNIVKVVTDSKGNEVTTNVEGRSAKGLEVNEDGIIVKSK